MYELHRTFRFESAHLLPHLPAEHKCRRLHGHSFQCDVFVRGGLDPQLGWVLDFGELKALVQPTIDRLDHTFLNDIKGLENPTSEILAHWIWQQIAPTLPGLYAVRIQETCNAACTYLGGDA